MYLAIGGRVQSCYGLRICLLAGRPPAHTQVRIVCSWIVGLIRLVFVRLHVTPRSGDLRFDFASWTPCIGDMEQSLGRPWGHRGAFLKPNSLQRDHKTFLV